jgi:hypothetical protein
MRLVPATQSVMQPYVIQAINFMGHAHPHDYTMHMYVCYAHHACNEHAHEVCLLHDAAKGHWCCSCCGCWCCILQQWQRCLLLLGPLSCNSSMQGILALLLVTAGMLQGAVSPRTWGGEAVTISCCCCVAAATTAAAALTPRAPCDQLHVKSE